MEEPGALDVGEEFMFVTCWSADAPALTNISALQLDLSAQRVDVLDFVRPRREVTIRTHE